jgi:hypothetical protein
MARNILPFHKRDTADTPPSRNPSTISNADRDRETPSPSRKSREHHHHHPHITHGRHAHHAHGHHPHLPSHIHRPHRKNAMHKYVNNFWRNEIVAALAEFAGTFMFLCKLTPLEKRADDLSNRASFTLHCGYLHPRCISCVPESSWTACLKIQRYCSTMFTSCSRSLNTSLRYRTRTTVLTFAHSFCVRRHTSCQSGSPLQ